MDEPIGTAHTPTEYQTFLAEHPEIEGPKFTIDELGFMQLADTKVLAAAARGEIDLNALARAELASRGCDDRGKWVGFAVAMAAL